MNETIDILESLDKEIQTPVYHAEAEEIKTYHTTTFTYTSFDDSQDTKEAVKQIEKKQSGLLSGVFFLGKYLLTCGLIFAILLVATNYSAYYNIAQSYVFSSQAEQKTRWLIDSVQAANIKHKYEEETNNQQEEIKKDNTDNNRLSVRRMKKLQDKEAIPFDIEITPYSNRVVIPKIGKNIPLIEVKDQKVDSQKQLNNIFMKELEWGIVRYPSSVKPGEEWTSFIFGHSSNFPWMKWDYNDVFSTLDNVEFDDEVIVYYWQKKHTYKIREKKVISPGDVGVLKRNKNKKEITLMTCWPIGTTLNRLIVTGELIE